MNNEQAAAEAARIYYNQYVAPYTGGLSTTSTAKLEALLRNAFLGIDTSSEFQAHMYFSSLADQFLTVAPDAAVNALLNSPWKHAIPTSTFGCATISEISPEASWNAQLETGCTREWFLYFLEERYRAFIPISAEPYQGTPVITGGDTLEIVAPTSSESQEIALPYQPGQPTAEVVTMPVPVGGGPIQPIYWTPPVSTPGAVQPPTVFEGEPGKTVAVATQAGDNTGLLMLAGAGLLFFIMSKRRREN